MREDLYVRRKYFYRRLGIDTFVKGLVGGSRATSLRAPLPPMPHAHFKCSG